MNLHVHTAANLTAIEADSLLLYYTETETLPAEWAGLDELDKLDAELVVNCTSIGMSPKIDATPVPGEYLNDGMTVFDTVYNPVETLLLKHAKERGAKTIDGISMFVNQAMIQFKLFTNQKGDAELMRKVVCEHLM